MTNAGVSELNEALSGKQFGRGYYWVIRYESYIGPNVRQDARLLSSRDVNTSHLQRTQLPG